MPIGKKRLDVLLVERGLAASRERAQALIMAGQVQVAGRHSAKAGSLLDSATPVEVRPGPTFASRGGVKLSHALERFRIDASDRIALDVGASTGGFTDVLLRGGARRVYAVDVGYGQLDYALRQNPRVVVMDRTNVRHLQELPELLDLAVVDVSFISLRLVLPPISRLLGPSADVVVLVKPQFEAGRESVGKGVIHSPAIWRSVLEGLATWLSEHGWDWLDLTVSPLKGAAGNVEFLAHLRRGHGVALPSSRIEETLSAVTGSDRAAAPRPSALLEVLDGRS